MRSTRGRRPWRPVISALLLLPAAALAQPGSDADRAVQLDQTIQSLKDEMVELATEAQAVENAALAPEEQRVSVYLGVDVRGLLLDTVTIRIDDRDPEVYHYDDQDARAVLAAQSLQRVLRTTVPQGAHRIHIEYSAHYADAKADAPPLADHYDAIFDKGFKEAQLEFTIQRGSRFGGDLRMSLKQWRTAK